MLESRHRCVEWKGFEGSSELVIPQIDFVEIVHSMKICKASVKSIEGEIQGSHPAKVGEHGRQSSRQRIVAQVEGS